MIYFYCQSYQAFNMALTLSLQEKVTIITSVENIVKACDFLKMDYITHHKFTLNDFIFKRLLVKIEIDRLSKIIADNELHFSHTQFAVFNFILAKTLNEENKKTVFHNFEYIYNIPNKNAWKSLSYIKLKIILILLRQIYGNFLTIRMSTTSSFMLSFKLDYIYNKCYKVIDNKNVYYEQTLKMFKEIHIDYPKIKNLFIAQVIINKNFFNTNNSAQIAKLLNNKHITIKSHPKLQSLEGFEKCNTIPEFLPVELFFNKVTNAVISYHSASLITASKFDFKTISLLDIISNGDSFMTDVKNDLILKSKSKIIFINSPKQLGDLIPSLL